MGIPSGLCTVAWHAMIRLVYHFLFLAYVIVSRDVGSVWPSSLPLLRTLRHSRRITDAGVLTSRQCRRLSTRDGRIWEAGRVLFRLEPERGDTAGALVTIVEIRRSWRRIRTTCGSRTAAHGALMVHAHPGHHAGTGTALVDGRRRETHRRLWRDDGRQRVDGV